MSILGMGTFEILVVLLVAFIFLGPTKMVDAGRTMGKAIRELRKMAAELPQVVINEETLGYGEGPAARHHGRREANTSTDEEKAPSQNQDLASDESGPVAFEPAVKPEAEDEKTPTDHGERT